MECQAKCWNLLKLHLDEKKNSVKCKKWKQFCFKNFTQYIFDTFFQHLINLYYFIQNLTHIWVLHSERNMNPREKIRNWGKCKIKNFRVYAFTREQKISGVNVKTVVSRKLTSKLCKIQSVSIFLLHLLKDSWKITIHRNISSFH